MKTALKQKRRIMADIKWSDFDKFKKDEEYLPRQGEGQTKATQAATALNKIVYKWFNDGDVYDNTYCLNGWCNDISSEANWLYLNIEGCSDILNGISKCYTESDYTELLYKLCEHMDTLDWNELNKQEKVGSVYETEGPFMFVKSDDEEY